MPYKSPDKQKEFQRDWVVQRRQNILGQYGCEICGATEELELYRFDPDAPKPQWSASSKRIEDMLDGFMILCSNHKVPQPKKKTLRKRKEQLERSIDQASSSSVP